jgi:CRISPR/Cas system CMR subunit Cmr6 (Cas7 group RAMP superfamily)
MKTFFVQYPLETVSDIDNLIASNSEIRPLGKISLLTKASGLFYCQMKKQWRQNNVHLEILAQSLSFAGLRFKTKFGRYGRYSNWVDCPLYEDQTLTEAIRATASRAGIAASECVSFLKRLEMCPQNNLQALRAYANSTYLTTKNDSLRLYTAYQQDISNNFRLLQNLKLCPEISQRDVLSLPNGSFGIQFDFELTSHWHSKDDTPLYPLENPVRKETVFKVPEMGATGWKGVFRQACRELELEEKLESELQTRLFGARLDIEENTGSDGCLRFFPSFFDRIELYVINPHDRKTKAGKNPIYFETVPPGGTSRFVLLYCVEPNADKKALEVDREMVTRIIHKVFTESGFGAKTAEGFGRARFLSAEENWFIEQSGQTATLNNDESESASSSKAASEEE